MKNAQLIAMELIERKIYLIRSQKVMFDYDLASLYNVSTKALKQAVKRNLGRFPEDFMFVLTAEELKILRSQFVTSSSSGWGGTRYAPMAFTEQGVAMLSSVLSSERAVEVNIQIMRAFVRLRQMLSTHVKLARKLEDIEKKYDSQFRVVFEAIRALMEEPQKPRRKIGFIAKEHRAGYVAKQKRQ
jgi:hypothetical protein